MRVFCDTSVMVAAVLRAHIHHAPAMAALVRIHQGEDVGYAASHSLAEAFSVLSRMPLKPKLEPADVLDILERDFVPHLIFLALQAEDYVPTMRRLATTGLGGGRIYDLLQLRVASKLALDRIYTFNENEWRMLWPDLAAMICVPPGGAAARPIE